MRLRFSCRASKGACSLSSQVQAVTLMTHLGSYEQKKPEAWAVTLSSTIQLTQHLYSQFCQTVNNQHSLNVIPHHYKHIYYECCISMWFCKHTVNNLFTQVYNPLSSYHITANITYTSKHRRYICAKSICDNASMLCLHLSYNAQYQTWSRQVLFHIDLRVCNWLELRLFCAANRDNTQKHLTCSSSQSFHIFRQGLY